MEDETTTYPFRFAYGYYGNINHIYNSASNNSDGIFW